MVAGCFLLLLVLVVLGWRERKRNIRKFSEITSRLAQVEELLLEVCSLVEERLLQEELSPLPNEPEEPVKPQRLLVETEELAEAAAPEEPPRPAEPGSTDRVARRVVSKQPEETNQPRATAAGKKESPVPTREQTGRSARTERPAQAKSNVAQPKLPAQEESRPAVSRKVKNIKGQKLSPGNQKIIELWRKGLSIQDIARQLEKGQGEVQLIVDLYCDERPHS
ncbi:MAG: hypothetical protein GX202_03510 [Firmicutes bacterium]|nr:hypothetical protein [Bacillota bacterium]